MTSLFKRINDVVAANINELVDRVEDPERMIKQIIREMEENIGNAKEGVIDALASEKRLKKELESHRQQAADWLARADKALDAGNESLAREALARKKEHERIAESMGKSWESARNTTVRLKSQLQALEHKLDEAKRKKGGLIARKRMANARDQMDRTLSSMDNVRDMETSFGRMEDKVLDMEAQLEAREELNDDHSQVEREFLDLEIDTEVEAELAALKKQRDATS
jgi:phage shock protein A